MNIIKILALLLLVGSCATPTAEEYSKDDPATALIAPAEENEVPQEEPSPEANSLPDASLPEVKTSDPFQEPACLQAAIDFWEKIYSVYSKDQMVIHHDRTFEIYLVVSVPPFEQKKSRQRAVKALLDKVRSKLPASEREFVRAQSGVRERFQQGVVLGQEHIPSIQQQLKLAGLPSELALIPLIESGFQASALSKVGARGYWQIMPGTLRLYTKTSKKKLADLNFSTQIAILIFKDSYDALGSWPLAINAYHSGIGRLRRATQELGTQDICPIVHEYQGKGYKFASRNYYAQFLAAKRLYGRSELPSVTQLAPSKESTKTHLNKQVKKKHEHKHKKHKHKHKKRKSLPKKH